MKKVYLSRHFDSAVPIPHARPGYFPARKKANSSSVFSYERFGKRLFDLLSTIVALPIVFPVLLLLAVIVRIDGKGVLYFQDRVGKSGKTFRMVKFRTMIPNAEEALRAHLAQNPEAAREWRRFQKLRKDPRITPIGRFLRSSSLDELPQIWNVLMGEMSIVGPRPMMLDQVSLYPAKEYLLMRPGITGAWQVSARNSCGFAERGHYDTQYWNELSFGVDVLILTKTAQVVLRRSGM